MPTVLTLIKYVHFQATGVQLSNKEVEQIKKDYYETFKVDLDDLVLPID